MLRLLLLSVALVVGTVVRAQRQITVLHSDTDEPIMGVTVRVGGTVLKTDRHGRVTIPEQFDIFLLFAQCQQKCRPLTL